VIWRLRKVKVRGPVGRPRTRPGAAWLPPIRQLAADLGLAANTIGRSYRALEAAGLVVSRVRAGTVVAARPDRGASEKSSSDAHRLLVEAARG